jgi:hypothetical protein
MMIKSFRKDSKMKRTRILVLLFFLILGLLFVMLFGQKNTATLQADTESLVTGLDVDIGLVANVESFVDWGKAGMGPRAIDTDLDNALTILITGIDYDVDRVITLVSTEATLENYTWTMKKTTKSLSVLQEAGNGITASCERSRAAPETLNSNPAQKLTMADASLLLS